MSSSIADRVHPRARGRSTILIYTQTILLLAVTLCPVLWLVQLSLKVENDAFLMPPKLLFWPTFENYAALFQGKFARSFGNSLMSAWQPRSSPWRAGFWWARAMGPAGLWFFDTLNYALSVVRLAERRSPSPFAHWEIRFGWKASLWRHYPRAPYTPWDCGACLS